MGDPSDTSGSTNIWRRPQTEELVDVHVYLVPSDKWIEQRKLAKRDIIDQAVSSGFVRVLPSTTLLELRGDINTQLGSENVPHKFVFLRSVGRNFTQVKSKQELELKVKSFLPPYAEEPEVYIKEGNYTAVRSASLSVLSRNTLFNNSDSPTEYPTTSESLRESRSENILPELKQKRTLSLDSIESKIIMTSIKTESVQEVAQRKLTTRQRNTRPPTPRVNERFFRKVSSYRSTSVSSGKMNESIRESPREQIEDRGSKTETLNIESEAERIISSPPPRPQSKPSKTDLEIKIPVPTPTPTDSSKNAISPLNGTILNNLNHPENNASPSHVCEGTNKNSDDGSAEEQDKEYNDSNSNFITSKEGNEKYNGSQSNNNHGDDEELDHFLANNDSNEGSEGSQISLSNIHSKMGDEDVIVDPIKMLQGEGDSLKNLEENSRDHYDEGFHSGELVASEEDSNSIETLGSSGVKNEENSHKPIRAATPMPRASSFYNSARADPEIRKLNSTVEEMRAEKRLRELKRDALLQKVRDLQKRKASSKDRTQEKLNIEFYPAREEWRKRFMEIKKSTPRLEDHCSKLRQELEKLVKDMLVSVKADADSKPHKPSKKTSYKIMIMRLLQEVEDLRRRLQAVTIKLNAETKLRSQAEFEVKRLRQELLHKKTQVTLTRKQTSFPPAEQFFISAV